MSDECPERRFRTLFISDVHLGARGSQAERLLDFLRTHDADTIYLVGDIVDGWALQSSWYWPQSHNDFVQKMLRKARKGAKVIYIPGNHDEFLRNYYGTHFGGIDVVENIIHEGADGRRYLVIHGDIFDLVVQNARWLAHIGDKAYDLAIRMNRVVNAARRWFGVPYWSLSQWAKLKVKNAVNYIGAFEHTLAGEARRHGADGVICGHIHYATIRDGHGIRYMNCGDWVESCTALADHSTTSRKPRPRNSPASAGVAAAPRKAACGYFRCKANRAGPSPPTTLVPGNSSSRNASRFFSTAIRPTDRKIGRGKPGSTARGRNSWASTPRGRWQRFRSPVPGT
jgi:UDP-2,3-diacylglucosamine pyrophosphatase LpxH